MTKIFYNVPQMIEIVRKESHVRYLRHWPLIGLALYINNPSQDDILLAGSLGHETAPLLFLCLPLHLVSDNSFAESDIYSH